MQNKKRINYAALQKDAKRKSIQKFHLEALGFEKSQEWRRAGIRWEQCARIAHKATEQGFYHYSAFFCYKNANDPHKAYFMIDSARKKYLLVKIFKKSHFWNLIWILKICSIF